LILVVVVIIAANNCTIVHTYIYSCSCSRCSTYK